MKCAIIDDSKSITMIVSEILETLGSTCRIFNDSLEGLDALQKETFDLVFLDISMEKLTGIEVLENLSKTNNISSKNIVICTAHSLQEEQLKELKALGVNKVLEKPFKINEIQEILDEYKIDH